MTNDEYSVSVKEKIATITRKTREYERQTTAAIEYAQAIKQSGSFNSFNFASRMIDMYQSRDWGNLTPDKKLLLNDFMKSAQKAEKFRMDQTNWSKKARRRNKTCINKHKKQGLGLLPFNNILFQTKIPSKFDKTIFFHLFEYKDKNLDLNYVTYDYRLLRVVDKTFRFEKEQLEKTTLQVPLDFSKAKKNICISMEPKIYFAWLNFLQLNSHTDKNTNIGIYDIKAKEDTGIGSLKIKDDKADNEDFIPVWKSKTVHIKPDQYRAERDTTYTSDISDESSHEKRCVPYHSVRGHIRRLRKGDITAVKAHFRGQKEYGAIHKNYVLAAPRIIRKGKAI